MLFEKGFIPRLPDYAYIQDYMTEIRYLVGDEWISVPCWNDWQPDEHTPSPDESPDPIRNALASRLQ